MANAEKLQPQNKQPRREHRLVVRANKSWHAESLNRIQQATQQENRRLISERRKRQHPPAAMVNDAKNRVKITIDIGLSRQINAPSSIDRNGVGRSSLPSPSQIRDLIPMPPQPIRHERLAHRHATFNGIQPIERHRNLPTSRVRHPSLEPNNFATHPVGFTRGATAPQFHSTTPTRKSRMSPLPSRDTFLPNPPKTVPNTLRQPVGHHVAKLQS